MQQYEEKKLLPEDVKRVLEHFGADLGASGEPEGKPELEEMVKDIEEAEEGSHAKDRRAHV